MTVDVDAVNERLNGLVNLLHVVGIDGVDPNTLAEQQQKISDSNNNDSAPKSAQSSDAQILEIIKKLQLAQADSPEILAALKSPELRALASLAAQKQPASKLQKPKKPAPSLDDVMDDDDNYPKIGPGYSDDISVVSDLTTPTVMTKQQVAEEEYYKDVNGGPGALPPMHVGVGAGQPSRPTGGPPMAVGGHQPKTRNLVSQVRPGAARRSIAKTGGAAAQRRLNYQQAMAKLHSSEYSAPAAPKVDKNYMEGFSPKKPAAKFVPTSPTQAADPSQFPSMADSGKKKSTRNKSAVSSKSKGRKKALAAQEVADLEFDEDTRPKEHHPPIDTASPRRSVQENIEWGTGDSGGWPAFDDVGKSKSSDPDPFGSDAFFSADVFAGSDPFAKTTPQTSTTSSSSSGKPKKPSRSSSRKEGQEDGGSGSRSRRTKKEGHSESERSSRREKSKKSKSKRASLAM